MFSVENITLLCLYNNTTNKNDNMHYIDYIK